MTEPRRSTGCIDSQGYEIREGNTLIYFHPRTKKRKLFVVERLDGLGGWHTFRLRAEDGTSEQMKRESWKPQFWTVHI